MVSDAEQALLELVKNSFDADSPFCNIEIDTAYVEEESTPDGVAHRHGLIRVSDGGTGMTLQQIRDGWLVISRSEKRPKDGGRKSPTKIFHRTPIGDKGLGRLSTMRLGDKLTIRTFTDSEPEGLQISFKWSDFALGVPLEQVTLEKKRIPKEKGRLKGTTIEVTGLNDLQHWKSSDRRKSLRANVSSLVSPFEQIDSFSVRLSYDGKPDVIEKLSQNQLERSAFELSAKWCDPVTEVPITDVESAPAKKLELAAKVRLSLFTGNSKKSTDQFARYIEIDKGKALFEYFKRHKESKRFSLEWNEDGTFSYGETLERADIPPDREYPFWADPGKFDAKLYYYMFTQELEAASAVVGGGDIVTKEKIKAMAGVSVFRDGFKVRFGDDWLRLSHGTTSGGSFYGLRPQNTLGYFNLSGWDNFGLVEKSDREGFVDNPDFRGFMTISRRIVKFSNDLLEGLRRAAVDYIRERSQVFLPGEELTPEQGVERIKGAVERLAGSQSRIESFTTSTLRRFDALKAKTSDVRNDLLIDPGVDQALINLNLEIDAFQEELKVVREEIKNSSLQLASDVALATQVSSRFEALHEQIQKLYESAAVGLSARGLVHDSSTFIDEIFSAIARIRSVARTNPVFLDDIREDLDRIQSAAKDITNYLALIDPMLPAQRLRRERIHIGKFVSAYFDVRKEQFDSQGIEVVLIDIENSLTVKMNRGRLLQVFDNLVRNSQYWILAQASADKASQLRITVEFSSAGFCIFDSGRGVREAIESSLFELFVTDKPASDASGMGLFIVKSLLETENCSVELLPERNKIGRRYKFQVNLTAVRA